ncbi:MAG: mannose-1-phosphate guanylyltransferase [Chitinispirillaceae bacterium]
MNVIPVILAGGIGERFWPLSRSSMPKQLHALTGKATMAEETLLRVNRFCSPGVKPLFITGAAIAQKAKEILPEKEVEIIVEPQGKNTAPAIALAAAQIQKRDGDGVMVIVSADHSIKPKSAFAEAVRYAVSLAQKKNELIIFGIKPSRPEVGYGYIELGEELEGSNDITAFKVRRFVEKPDHQKAVEFKESGKYLWNSGMFVWKASSILEEFEEQMPELYDQVMKLSSRDFSKEAIAEFYSECCKESIDFGIMENAKAVNVVCGNFTWDDIGSWESLSRIHGTNEDGTTVTGPLVFESDCRDTLIVNKSERTLAAIGLKNVAVVSVDDAVLVIERSRLPALKKYLSQIKDSQDFPKELF